MPVNCVILMTMICMECNLMNENTVQLMTEVIQLSANILQVPLETVNPDTTFEYLGADSLDILEIIITIEDQWHIDLVDELCITPQAIVDQLIQKV